MEIEEQKWIVEHCGSEKCKKKCGNGCHCLKKPVNCAVEIRNQVHGNLVIFLKGKIVNSFSF